MKERYCSPYALKGKITVRTLPLLFAFALFVSLGCGQQPQVRDQSKSPASRQAEIGDQEKEFSDEIVHFGDPRGQEQNVPRENGNAMAKMERPAVQKAALAEPSPRKIIRSADIKVIVNDFAQAEQALTKLIGDLKDGYLAQAVITGSAGSPRSGLWKVRVPVDQLDAFVAAAIKLGIPEKNSIDSKDVTEEYFDLEARIKNKKVEEARLLKHLEQSTGKLEDILAVEREISRVRGEIEQHQGRLRLLANLTALTTVTITIQEIKNYVPPQTPTFTSSIGSTFFGSFEVLVGFGKGLILIGVALAPWLPPIAALGILTWLLLRGGKRRVPTSSSTIL
jgi:hypothetical protein